MPPRQAPQWSEKLLAGLFIICRSEFIAEKPELFPMQRRTEFASFLEWVKSKAQARANAIDDSAPELSHAGCVLFDTLTSVAHGKKVGEDAASMQALQTLAFSERAELVHKSNLTQAVTQAYKWSKFLVQYSQASKRIYRGPLQMLEIYGKLTGTKIEASPSIAFHMPFPLLKTILQHNMVSELASQKRPESHVLALSVYIHSLCRQFVTRSKRPLNSAEDAKKWFADTLSVVNVLFTAWDVFARKIGFTSLSEMVSPHICFNEATAEMYLIPDTGHVLSPEYEYKLLLVDTEASASVSAVSMKSEEAPVLFRNMSSQVCGHLRTFTHDFFQDIHTTLTSSEMYKGEASEELSIFKAAPGELAPRFYYPESTISSVTAAVSNGRKEGVVADLQTAHDEMVAERMQSANTQPDPEPVLGPTCGEKCSCCRPYKRQLLMLLVNKFCAMVQSDFRDLKSTFIDYEIHVPSHSVQLIITEPPAKVRGEHKPPSKNHDTLKLSDYNLVAHLAYEFLRPGGHLVLFCDVLHLKSWYDVFACFITPNTDGEHAFNISSGPLLCLPFSKEVSRDPCTGPSTHSDVAKYALHVVRVSSVACPPPSMVSWRAHGHISNTFSPRTNVIDNVPAPSLSEIRVANKSSQRLADEASLSLNQMSVPFLQELVCRYTLPGDTVLDPFGGSFSTAAACLTVSEPRSFYGADINNSCVERGIMRCLRELAVRILSSSNSPKDVFNVDDSTKKAAQELYSKKFKHLDRAEPSARLDSDSVKTPHRALPITQILPQSMRLHLVNILDDGKFMTDLYEHHGPDNWPRTADPTLSASTCATLRAAEAARFSLHLSRSYLLTTASTRQNGETLGYYNGILVYENLGKLHGSNVWYGSGWYRIGREFFLSHRVPLLSEEQGSGNVHIPYENVELHDIFIVPALFCPFHFVKFHPDLSSTNARLCVKPIRNFGSILQPTHVAVRASKTIRAGEPIVLHPRPVYDSMSF